MCTSLFRRRCKRSKDYMFVEQINSQHSQPFNTSLVIENLHFDELPQTFQKTRVLNYDIILCNNYTDVLSFDGVNALRNS